MSLNVTLGSVIRSEWLKFRTVRSSITGVLVTFVLTIGLGALVTSLLRAHWSTTDAARRLTFDPVATSLVGIIFAQFAIGVGRGPQSCATRFWKTDCARLDNVRGKRDRLFHYFPYGPSNIFRCRAHGFAQ